jgi:phosphoglycolate phosphatase-like HAD superfamily hydrolase
VIVVFPDRATGDDWMHALATHYAVIRDRYPTDELSVVFDIDGTILDLRYLMAHVLLSYDRDRGTDLFRGLVAEDITTPENRVEDLLEGLEVPEDVRNDVAAFYRFHLWDEDGLIAASAPYRGVLSVIRWFEIQPGTRVALNTGRPEHMRRITLDSLNAVGEAARVRFDPELLFMRSEHTSVPEAKVLALDEIRARGLHILAVIDNEPENLAAMIASRHHDDVLFLHADTMFDSQRRDGLRAVRGTVYDLGALISEDRLREHVELVWHGVNDAENLQQFLDSGITWAEVDLRSDPIGRLVLRHDGFDERPWSRDEPATLARPSVQALAAAGRSIKIDVKGCDDTVRTALDLIGELDLGDDRVWFNGKIDEVGAAGFDAFRDRYPDATASCPIDFLAPLLAVAPDEADVVLERLRSWGVSRLSVSWEDGVRRTIGELERRGWETNVYAVPDLQSFLEAAVLLPTSVTADFNFPAWRYFGRGSGQHGVGHRHETGDRPELLSAGLTATTAVANAP